jgi:uncharacterized protein (DUF433 family)
MSASYVEQTEGAYRIAGTRFSLDSVVYDFLNGLSPESIVDNFEGLTLEQVYGAITYYLAHRNEVDAYLQRNREKFEALRVQARTAHPLLYQKLETRTRDLQEV